jgi:putative membrane-bound dehydrogenase-like protein
MILRLALLAFLLAQQEPRQDSSKLAPPAPVPPAEAPGRMSVPEGFKVTLFAGEPDLVQPMAFTIDDRGRLWVVESFCYPNWTKPGEPGKDRIVILEDADGDGRFDSRKVFAEKLANVSGIALGFGGVWLTATPVLAFLPDRDGDDAPDGPPEPLLDGWDLKAKHNVFCKPMWGPDGWLYGCNGILSNSKVGAPGTPEEKRVAFNCGVWRYHPLRRTFETVAHGTTNPWGLDWDERGELFVTNCVIKHAWHVVPGAHFERMFGQDQTAPNLYALMPSTADHLHWKGEKWTDARGQTAHADLGGGHAHVGAMVYLGDNWPDRYRGGLFTLNLHGHRMQNDLLEPKGSSIAIRHGKDFLVAGDPWFRGLDCQTGPDGGVYVSDWSDTGECHDYDVCDTTNGRIHKVTWGTPARVRPDVAKLPDAELVRLQLHRNDWWVRAARRNLQERSAAGKLEAGTTAALRKILDEDPDTVRKLRAVWALRAVGGLDAAALLGHADPAVRAWAVRLELEDGDGPVERLAAMAREDASAQVRRELASGLQRLPVAKRAGIAEGLVARAEDAEDPYLPYLVWYGIEPLVGSDPAQAVSLLSKAKLPLVRRHITRRMTAK